MRDAFGMVLKGECALHRILYCVVETEIRTENRVKKTGDITHFTFFSWEFWSQL